MNEERAKVERECARRWSAAVSSRRRAEDRLVQALDIQGGSLLSEAAEDLNTAIKNEAARAQEWREVHYGHPMAQIFGGSD